jgi:hypothetical protein
MQRLAQRLALDVPERHLDPGEHAYQRYVGPHAVAGAIDAAPQGLDRERVHALDMPREDIGDHGGDDVGAERIAIDLADAADAVIGGQLHENEIAAAE